MELVNQILALLAYLFVITAGLAVLGVIVLYFVDRTQTKHAVRRNYPVVGRFRYFFEELGEFFRQYFFAMDREEMPFNRAERSWVYRAAKGIDNTIAFGSPRERASANSSRNQSTDPITALNPTGLPVSSRTRSMKSSNSPTFATSG